MWSSAMAWHPPPTALRSSARTDKPAFGMTSSPACHLQKIRASHLLQPLLMLGTTGRNKVAGDEDEDMDSVDVPPKILRVTACTVAPPPCASSTALPAGAPPPKGRGPLGRRFLCYKQAGHDHFYEGRGLGRGLPPTRSKPASTTCPKYRKAGHKFTDYHGFCLAALCDKGAMYASKATSKVKAVLMFQPLESSLCNNWTLGLPEGEDVLAVAVGSTFCAAATSSRLLRIFSHSGLEMEVGTLEGSAVSLAADGAQLAVVWHRGSPTDEGDQQLAFAIYALPSFQQLAGGALPVSPASTLTWLGFSQAGPLASYDSKGVLRIHRPRLGGSWLPVFEAVEGKGQAGNHVHWPVGLNHKSFFYILCSKEDPYPKVLFFILDAVAIN
eukprot:jgi/Botrbrau1/212/Bobra.0022s0192.1